jgi:hypothetical protein
MNSFMKQTLKNRAHGVASIMKNYNTHERTTMSGTLYLDNVAKFQSLCKLQPVNGLPFQSLGAYVTSLHVEPPEETGDDRTIIYDIPSSNVIEMRGAPFNITLTAQDINNLLEDNMDICNEVGFSALKLIMQGFIIHRAKYPLQFDGDMLGYMRYLLDGSHPVAYQRVITNFTRRKDPDCRRQINSDLDILRALAVDMETPTLEIRFVLKCLEMT